MATRSTHHFSLKICLIFLVVLLIAIISVLRVAPKPVSAPAASPQPIINHVTYNCHDKKTIDATYYPNSIGLILSDGRKMELPQVMSGSGARYANASESFVFWNKGDTAFIQEGVQTTYAGCVENK